jgi:antitoxin component of MazEF toxin-antitoxin module
MYRAKLFKNGNSVVMAMPQQLCNIFGWKAGQELCLHDYTPENKPKFHTILIHEAETTSKETPPHARKTTHKTR